MGVVNQSSMALSFVGVLEVSVILYIIILDLTK